MRFWALRKKWTKDEFRDTSFMRGSHALIYRKVELYLDEVDMPLYGEPWEPVRVRLVVEGEDE